jgi:predicted MFS family arabinose efflux permease
LIFGAFSFAQCVGEPTEGLISQPLQSMLLGGGLRPARIGAFLAVLGLPWALKPLFGLVTDFVPLLGSRRRSYLVVTGALGAAGLTAASLARWEAFAPGRLLAMLIVPAAAVAFADVVADAWLVERGRALGMIGRFQAAQWAGFCVATVLNGVGGGWITGHQRPRLAFAACAGLSALSTVLAILFVRDAEEPVRVAASRRGLVRLFGSKAWAGVAAFLFLWNFNPFQNTVLNHYSTAVLGLTGQEYGNSVALLAVGSIAASLAYGLYCRRVPLRRLVHASIVLGIAGTLAYGAVRDARSAAVVAVVVGMTYTTASLIQLDLAARACPPEVAGTAFATLMALENLATALATGLGGDWYQRGIRLWGPHGSFRVLLGVGATFTAACWVLVPLLPRNLGPDEPEGPTRSASPARDST